MSTGYSLWDIRQGEVGKARLDEILEFEVPKLDRDLFDHEDIRRIASMLKVLAEKIPIYKPSNKMPEKEELDIYNFEEKAKLDNYNSTIALIANFVDIKNNMLKASKTKQRSIKMVDLTDKEKHNDETKRAAVDMMASAERLFKNAEQIRLAAFTLEQNSLIRKIADLASSKTSAIRSFNNIQVNRIQLRETALTEYGKELDSVMISGASLTGNLNDSQKIDFRNELSSTHVKFDKSIELAYKKHYNAFLQIPKSPGGSTLFQSGWETSAEHRKFTKKKDKLNDYRDKLLSDVIHRHTGIELQPDDAKEILSETHTETIKNFAKVDLELKLEQQKELLIAKEIAQTARDTMASIARLDEEFALSGIDIGAFIGNDSDILELPEEDIDFSISDDYLEACQLSLDIDLELDPSIDNDYIVSKPVLEESESTRNKFK